MIVKVKSREMTALSKSNVEKIRTVKDQKKTGWGHKPAENPQDRGDFYVPSRLCLLENKSLSLSFNLENSILC